MRMMASPQLKPVSAEPAPAAIAMTVMAVLRAILDAFMR